MPESIYIQRQFMTFLGLEVYAEEIFFRVDDRDTDYVNTDMVLDRAPPQQRTDRPVAEW